MSVTASEAQAHVASFNARNRQQLPRELMAERKPVYVHNIYNKSHLRELGSLRTWNIPACPPGQAYATLTIPGLIADEYDTGDGNGSMGVLPVMGGRVAMEIVGSNSNLKDVGLHTTNKEWWGVFASPNEVPTKEELEAAHEKLRKFFNMLVQDGNRKNMQGSTLNPGEGINSISDVHRQAALYLGQNVPWAQNVQVNIECPGCGDPCKPNIIKHSCGYVFDQKRYRENMAVDDPKKK